MTNHTHAIHPPRLASQTGAAQNATPASQFTLTPRGRYSLAASMQFLEGFTPAAYRSAETGGHLHLAFVVDGGEQVAGVCLRQGGDAILGEVFGEGRPGAVRSQVERILSLDVDGSGFAAVGQRDPAIGRLQARYPGLRPVCFYAPYEAAAWAIIGQRIRITQAARIKDHMTHELGQEAAIHGERMHAFPGPARLRQLESFPGLFGRKVEYLRALAEATLQGRLDAAHLRALPAEVALAGLKELPGVGDFAAGLILLRGAGEPDYLPLSESRLPRAVERAYALSAPPSMAELGAIGENWRPYRTWVTFLLRVMLEDETHEIGGRTVRTTTDSTSGTGV